MRKKKSNYRVLERSSETGMELESRKTVPERNWNRTGIKKNSSGTEAPGIKIQLRFEQMYFDSRYGVLERRNGTGIERNWNQKGKMMSKYAFGVDIGGTTVKLGLFGMEGNVLDKWEIPTVKENGGKAILPDVAKSILAKMEERGIGEQDVAGIGVGAPGSVDSEGTLVGGAVNIGWKPFNIPEAVSAYIKVPVKAANDANAAAYGEMWQGGGKGYGSMVAVTLGTGVGGGIVIGGHILTGATGGGGEIGHIHVEDSETEPCNCGNKGCLEQYASATGIVRLAKRRLQEDEKPSTLRRGNLSAKSVFDAVKEGDEVAIEIAGWFGEYLGKGLAAVAAVVNPEVFVIGGGVSKAGEILLTFVEEPFQKYVFGSCAGAKFTLAELGNDAGIYGAAGMILAGG